MHCASRVWRIFAKHKITFSWPYFVENIINNGFIMPFTSSPFYASNNNYSLWHPVTSYYKLSQIFIKLLENSCAEELKQNPGGIKDIYIDDGIAVFRYFEITKSVSELVRNDIPFAGL